MKKAKPENGASRNTADGGSKKPKQKRLFRRQVSNNDQILRDRNKFEKQNREIAGLIVEKPALVGELPIILEWALRFVDVPLEDDGAELRIVE